MAEAGSETRMRTPDHPSGAKQTLCIRLSPDHRTRLERIAQALNLNLSDTIAQLVDQATP